MYTLGSEQTHFVSDKPSLTSNSDDTPSGFLKLSPEIRNKIYCLTLVTTSVMLVDMHPWQWEAEKKNRHPTRTSYKTLNAKASYTLWTGSSFTRPTISMLALNRQTRAEAVPIFYGNNVIRFYRMSPLIPFLMDRSKLSLQSIRYFRLDLEINVPRARQWAGARTFAKLPKTKALNLQKLTVNISDPYHLCASKLNLDAKLRRWVHEMAKYIKNLDMFGVTVTRAIGKDQVREASPIEEELWDLLAPKMLRKVRDEPHDAKSLLKRRILYEEI